MTTQSKLSKALEIRQAMEFLNIPASHLQSLLQRHGGIDGLHQEMERRLCPEIIQDPVESTTRLFQTTYRYFLPSEVAWMINGYQDSNLEQKIQIFRNVQDSMDWKTRDQRLEHGELPDWAVQVLEEKKPKLTQEDLSLADIRLAAKIDELNYHTQSNHTIQGIRKLIQTKYRKQRLQGQHRKMPM